MFLFVFVGLENLVSKTFHDCIGHPGGQQSANGAYQYAEIFIKLSVRQAVCSLHVVDVHNGFFALVGTVAVAVFTFTLWRSTDRLWISAEYQRQSIEEGRIAEGWQRFEEQRRMERALATAKDHAEAADRTADAAAQTLGATRDIAAKQLRAYVLVEAARIDEINLGDTPKVTVTLKNFGQTPAHKMAQWCSMGWDHYPPKVSPPTGEFDERFSRSPIGAGGKFFQFRDMGKPMPQSALDELRAGTHAIWVAGCVEYTDIFGVVQTTKYLMFLGGPIRLNSNGSLAPYLDGNTAT